MIPARNSHIQILPYLAGEDGAVLVLGARLQPQLLAILEEVVLEVVDDVSLR